MINKKKTIFLKIFNELKISDYFTIKNFKATSDQYVFFTVVEKKSVNLGTKEFEFSVPQTLSNIEIRARFELALKNFLEARSFELCHAIENFLRYEELISPTKLAVYRTAKRNHAFGIPLPMAIEHYRVIVDIGSTWFSNIVSSNIIYKDVADVLRFYADLESVIGEGTGQVLVECETLLKGFKQKTSEMLKKFNDVKNANADAEIKEIPLPQFRAGEGPSNRKNREQKEESVDLSPEFAVLQAQILDLIPQGFKEYFKIRVVAGNDHSKLAMILDLPYKNFSFNIFTVLKKEAQISELDIGCQVWSGVTSHILKVFSETPPVVADRVSAKQKVYAALLAKMLTENKKLFSKIQELKNYKEKNMLSQQTQHALSKISGYYGEASQDQPSIDDVAAIEHHQILMRALREVKTNQKCFDKIQPGQLIIINSFYERFARGVEYVSSPMMQQVEGVLTLLEQRLQDLSEKLSLQKTKQHVVPMGMVFMESQHARKGAYDVVASEVPHKESLASRSY